MTDLHVRVWGEGERAVLVHGSMSNGRTGWYAQRPLSERGYALVVPDRRGYGRSPDVEGEDFDTDADDIVDLLDAGAHVVGHSYGGLGVLLAAAHDPERVRTVTVVEPPAFAVAREEPAVERVLDEHRSLWSRARDLDDREFMEAFVTMMGADLDAIPESLIDTWESRTRPLRLGRPAWEADIPLRELAMADLPLLVVSGGYLDAFERICDRLADVLGARREIIKGAGHEVQRNAERFNRLLLEHWNGAP